MSGKLKLVNVQD